MPYGGTSPEEDKKIESCVGSISGTNKRTGKPYTESEKIAICKENIMTKSYIFSEITEFKSEGEEYWIEGVASSTTPDLGNDVVAEPALRQMADMFNKSYANGTPQPFGYEHTEILGGRPNIVPLGSIVKAWVDNARLFIKGSLNKMLSVFPQAKAALERKDLHSLSIEYIPEPSSLQFVDGKRIINAMKAIVGLGITGRPMNPDALIQFYAKNLDFQTKMEHEVHKEGEEEPCEECKKKNQDKTEVEEKKMPNEPIVKKANDEQPPAVEVKKVEVSPEDYQMLVELKAKAEDEKVTGKFSAVATKVFNDNLAKLQASPAFNPAPKFDGAIAANVPVEVKNYFDALESKTATTEDRWKAAGRLHGFYVKKGIQLRSSSPEEYVLMAKEKNMTVAELFGLKLSEVMDANINKGAVEIKNLVQLKAQLESDTSKVTSGTAMYQQAAELNDIYGPVIFSHLNELHTTFGLLKKVDASDYGENYGFRFKSARPTGAGSYAEGTTTPTAQVTQRRKANIPFMYYRSSGQVSGQMIAAASGRGGIGDVYAEEIKDHTEALLQSLNVDIFDSSTPSAGMTKDGQMLSLAYLVDDSSNSSTLYAYDRTSGNFTTLQGGLTAKSNTPYPTKEDLRIMYTASLSNGAEHGDLVFVTSFTQYRKLLTLLDDAQRFNSTSPTAGFWGNFTFDGIPIYPDASCDAGYIYQLDLKHTFIAVQVPPMVEELAKTGDFRQFQVKSYLALVSTAPNHNYKMTGFNTS